MAGEDVEVTPFAMIFSEGPLCGNGIAPRIENRDTGLVEVAVSRETTVRP
jgi:hypothetical protein